MYNTVHSVCKLLTDPGEMATEERGTVEDAQKEQMFFVTRDSQNIDKTKPESRKLSYVGMRNLSDPDKIDEKDILSSRGTLRGIKNRVRAGLANFENPKALKKVNTERGKVVVYTTSFRGVRATFEECRYILDLFHNLRVRVEERDIYIHKFFFKELEDRLQHYADQLKVPQVFINGQHIGGKMELEQLNETGELRKILANFPRIETANNCQLCGGFEFIPCRKCDGSKNSVANKFTREFRALRCTYCNENGLEHCPACAKGVDTSKDQKTVTPSNEKNPGSVEGESKSEGKMQAENTEAKESGKRAEERRDELELVVVTEDEMDSDEDDTLEGEYNLEQFTFH